MWEQEGAVVSRLHTSCVMLSDRQLDILGLNFQLTGSGGPCKMALSQDGCVGKEVSQEMEGFSLGSLAEQWSFSLGPG